MTCNEKLHFSTLEPCSVKVTAFSIMCKYIYLSSAVIEDNTIDKIFIDLTRVHTNRKAAESKAKERSINSRVFKRYVVAKAKITDYADYAEIIAVYENGEKIDIDIDRY